VKIRRMLETLGGIVDTRAFIPRMELATILTATKKSTRYARDDGKWTR